VNELPRERLGGLLLAEAGISAEAAGAGLLLLCTNTTQKVTGQIKDVVSIPLLHRGPSRSDWRFRPCHRQRY